MCTYVYTHVCIHIWRYFPRCYEREQCSARKRVQPLHLPRVLWRRGFSARGEGITPAEIVFQFRRYDLYNSQRSRYLSVNLHGIPIAPGANSEVKCCVYVRSLDGRRNRNDIIDTKRFLYPRRHRRLLQKPQRASRRVWRGGRHHKFFNNRLIVAFRDLVNHE